MIIRNIILFIVIAGIACGAFIVTAPKELNQEVVQYQAITVFALITLGIMGWFISWIHWQPLNNLIKRREQPWRWSDVFRVKQDGSIFSSLEENPRELFFDTKQKKDKTTVGIPITQNYHKNGFFGNPIHILAEGKNETLNLLAGVTPSKDDKLANTVMAIKYNEGYADGVADTLKEQKGDQWSAILPWITIIGLIGVGYLVSQNTDLLKQIATTLATMAAPVVAGA